MLSASSAKFDFVLLPCKPLDSCSERGNLLVYRLKVYWMV